MQKLLTVYVHHFLLSLRASCAEETADLLSGTLICFVGVQCWILTLLEYFLALRMQNASCVSLCSKDTG